MRKGFIELMCKNVKKMYCNGGEMIIVMIVSMSCLKNFSKSFQKIKHVIFELL